MSLPQLFRTAFDVKQNLLRLVQPPEQRYGPLDGIRTVALLWVLMGHVMLGITFVRPEKAEEIEGALIPMLLLDESGPVDIFFALSGFLVGGIVIREMRKHGQIGMKRFFARRFIRLIPPYYVSLVLCVFLWPFARHEQAWTNVLFINNYTFNLFMPWAWTMAVEMHFLLVLPLLVWLLYQRPRWALPALTGLLLIFVMGRWIEAELLGRPDFRQTHSRFVGFIPGLMAAHLYEFERDRIHRWLESARIRRTLVVGLSLLFFALVARGAYLPREPGSVMLVADGAFALVLIVGTLMALTLVLSHPAEDGWVKRILASRACFACAQVTYSAYLLHPIVIIQYYVLVGPPGSVTEALLLSPLLVALCLLAATAFFLLVEQPAVVIRTVLGQRRGTLMRDREPQVSEQLVEPVGVHSRLRDQ